MAHKVYRRGGYFYVVDASTGRERDGLAKDVKVTRASTTSDVFYFKHVNNLKETEPFAIGDIQKANGDLYTLSEFIEFYEQATSTDVNIQDATSPLFIVKASNLVTETTTTTLGAIDDYIINVDDATGFVVGQYLTIYNADANRVFFADVLAINTLAITLDTPLDFEFPSGSFVSVGNTNMNVNGSVTPVIFGIRNPTGVDIPLSVDITRIMLKCLTDTSVDLSKFGDIVGGLTNGIILRQVDGHSHNVFNVKTNGDLKLLMYDLDIEAAQGNQQDGFTGRLTFGGQNKMGAVIRLKTTEDMQVIVQDDLTSLDTFNLVAEGSQVTD